MCQLFGHLLIAHTAMKRVLPEIEQAYPGHVSFGCQGPDMFYNLYAGGFGYGAIADAIHASHTQICYAKMLEKIKESIPESREHQAGRAYAHAFYSHVIADCVFHPYVNRLADNNWAGGSDRKLGSTRHKTIETHLDDCMVSSRNLVKSQLSQHISCSSDNPLEVDLAVARMLDYAFCDAYSDRNDLTSRFNGHEPGDMLHPVNEGYRAYLEYAGAAQLLASRGFNVNLALSGTGLASRMVEPSQWDVSDNQAVNSSKAPWSTASGNENLNYTGFELLQISLNAVAEAVQLGEEFLQSEKTDALSFFQESLHPYLHDDCNLDTGLPSRFNDDADNRSEDGNIRFAFQTELLESLYGRFNYLE